MARRWMTEKSAKEIYSRYKKLAEVMESKGLIAKRLGMHPHTLTRLVNHFTGKKLMTFKVY